MATTNIELDIENITGVADANAQFIKTAQKFVVSSIPKDLMLWAGTSTAAATHGGDNSPTAVTLPQPTDSIIDVVRNGFSAEQVPESMQGFIDNSSSLHKATVTFPKYYIQAGNKVVVKPDPTASQTALVNYVDFLKVDDDCDLRGAVVAHAASKEFEQLASAQSTGVLTALTAVNAEIDECLSIADNVHTEIALINSSTDSALTEIGLANAEVDKMATEVGLDNAEVDLAKTELAEAATLVDSNIDTATAAIATAAGRVNTAVALANAQFDAAVLEAAQAEGEADDGAIATALGLINTQVDSAVSIASNMHTYLGNANTRIGTAKGEIDIAKTEAAEIATQTDNSGDINTALAAINTALDNFRGTSDPALFGDEDTYLSGTGITRVKAALDKAIALLDGNAPSSATDADAWIVDEDIEMLSGLLNTSQTQVQIANAQLAEWNAAVQTLQTEANGFANEVSARVGFTGAKSQAVQSYISTANAYLAEVQQDIALAAGYANAIGAYINAAQGYAAEVQAYQVSTQIFAGTSQNRINAGNAFIAEATASGQEAQVYASEVQSRIAQVQSQVGVAQGYIASGAGYSRVADGYAKIAQGYLGTAGSYLQAAQGYSASAQAYSNEIQTKVNIAQGYSTEVQSRLAHKSAHSQSADRYYRMAQQEVAAYVQNNSKMINRTLMAQAQQQAG